MRVWNIFYFNIYSEVKMEKTIRLFIIMAVCSILFMACSKKGVDGLSEKSDYGQDKGETDKIEKDIDIAVISSPNGVDDGNFNEDIYRGISTFINKYPNSEVTPIREVSGEPEAAVETVSDIADEYDVIVCCGFQFSGIGTVVKNFPQKKFILVDGYPTDENGKEIVCDNVYAMKFKDQESGFFAGMAAAFESKTKKVSVITGMPFPSNVNYQLGFESGVNYANERYYTGVEIVELSQYAGVDIRGKNVGGNYLGSFDDRDKGKAVGKELIAKGCDVIFVAAGGAGNGVFDAVKEDKKAKEIMVIGCDVDQYDDGRDGNSNIILTSALKVMHANVEKQLETVVKGSFKGENALLGADTDSTGYVKENGRNQLLAYTTAKLDEAYNLIKKGSIVPAANFNDMTPNDFQGLKKVISVK